MYVEGSGSVPEFTAWQTAGTESDTGACYSNDTEHVSSNDTRVEGNCTSSFRLSNFGLTGTEVPSGSTINSVEVHVEAHGGSASQANRRRYDLWMVDGAASDCSSPGIDNHQLPQNAEDDTTFLQDDLADPLWGCTAALDQADVVDTDFGIRWQHTASTGGNVIGIDFVEIRVEFTPP